MRFYGRGPAGNRILSEGEVAALYARRRTWEADRDELLQAELAAAPEPDPRLGYLLAYARPVVPDDSMVERVANSLDQLKELLLGGARSWGHVRPERPERGGSRDYDPDLRKAIQVSRRGTSGWRLSTISEDTVRGHATRDEDKGQRWISYTARLDLDFDGTGHLFVGRIADTTPEGQLVFIDTILAGNLASFFAAMGAFYEAANYPGHVDVGVAVTGIEGASPWGLHHWGDNQFSGPVPERTTRVSAAELRDEPKALTLSLIGRLLVATRGDPNYTPFDEQSEQ